MYSIPFSLHVSSSSSLHCVDKIWEKIVAEAMSSWMQKYYGCEQVAKGVVGGSKNFSRLPGLRNSLEMSRISTKGSSNKEMLHMVIKHDIKQVAQTNRVM